MRDTIKLQALQKSCAMSSPSDCVRPPKSQKDPFSLEELRNITPKLAGIGLLNNVGWALGNESVDLCYHQLRQPMRSA